MSRKARIIECVEFEPFQGKHYSIYRLQHKYFGFLWLTLEKGNNLAELIKYQETITPKNYIVWGSED